MYACMHACMHALVPACAHARTDAHTCACMCAYIGCAQMVHGQIFRFLELFINEGLRSCHQDTLAERSKALAQGASP